MIKKLFIGATLLAGAFVFHALLLMGILSIYSGLSASPSPAASLALMFGLPLAILFSGFLIFEELVVAGMVSKAAFIALLILCGAV